MPSSTVPSTIASAEPFACAPPESLRSAPPMRSISQSPPKKTPQPASSPKMIEPWPEVEPIASSTRSNATALISTPAPKPMISPIVLVRMRNSSATTAPMTSDEAASRPQANDAATRRRV